ncbi:MAG: hypothetical protein EA376_12945 [Phycisphaeraceae bacterium]|nr:MAG: hypothetical protein EA376_12945 [Phycisphaeraceae bacterium]
MNAENRTGETIGMKAPEMLELASLDALGLLDPEERRAFEAAFREASPDLQAQIRREQQRVAADEHLLPRVEPDASLRDRVLNAVRAAMSSISSAETTRDVIGRIGHRAWALRGNVSPLWRAACIGFATATVVLLTVGYSIQRDYHETLVSLRDGNFAEEIGRNLHPKFIPTITSPDTRFAKFLPAGDLGAEIESGQAVFIVNPVTKTGLLICRGLSSLDGEYSVVVLDEAGVVMATLDRFTTRGELMNREIAKAAELDEGSQVAILAPQASGQPGRPILLARI